jgi:hypothetical protein
MPTIKPSARALALPPQYMKLRAIKTMLALDELTTFSEDDILAALLYMEAKGEVSRAPTHGGWRSRIPQQTSKGGAVSSSRPAPLFQTYNERGQMDG